MATHANSNTISTKLNRNVLTMPKWVTETNDRIGPKPPPPPNGSSATSNSVAKAPALPPKSKNLPEPDYEVIEFSSQQYSNEVIRPNAASSKTKTPEPKLKCTLCGSNNPWVTCDECAQQIFCASCDDMFHKHPKRRNHVRKALEQSLPPLPPKMLPGQNGPTPPVAPPRRKQRGMATPLLQRKDQVNSNALQPPPSPTPSMKSSSWQDRVSSLKRGLNLMNRPLPETPKAPTTPSDGASSRSTTPKSVFDNIQRPPSVTLEKIKSKASATLDRMALLQQRYRQHKQDSQQGGNLSRNGSITEQNLSFDQWSNISPSPSHFRSGSMSSGINSSHFDLTDDAHFHNLFHQRQMQQPTALQRNGALSTRGMSSSVFNLNQINRRGPEQHNAWMTNPMQQAQSVAHLNCMNCNSSGGAGTHWPAQQRAQMSSHGQSGEWGNQFCSQQQLNRSNLSLNVGAGYMLPHHHHHGGSMMAPPPVFMNQTGMMANMYPYPYGTGMPVMSPGLMAMPPSARSRATSRAGSRAASPAMSRKSMPTRRKRTTSYVEDELTDDEDSDQDDRRSITSNRSGMASASRTRQRRISSASQLLDEENEANSRNTRSKMRDARDRRGSIAKSVQSDWLPGRRANTTSSGSNRQSESTTMSNGVKPTRIYSDLDSESSGTRALVQAKIQEKLDKSTTKRSSSKEHIAKTAREKPTKVSTEVQAGGTRSNATTTSDAKTNVTEENEKQESDTNDATKSESEAEAEQEKSSSEEQGREEEEKETNDKAVTASEDTNAEQPAPETNAEEDAEDDLGPPPSAPDHEWECEFCTYVNEPNVKICLICCKTPSRAPRKPSAATEVAKPKDTTKDMIIEKPKDKPSQATAAVTKVITEKTQQSSTKKKSTETQSLTNGVSKLKTTSSENESDTTAKAAMKKKESLEDIWAALDDNIQTTANKILRSAEGKQKKTKVSTSCGTSPVRELTAPKQEEKSIQRSVKETGTSPPPQSISTQTYDVLPLRQPETSVTEPTSESVGNGSTIFYNESPQIQRDVHSPLSAYSPEIPHYEPRHNRDPETELYILLKEAELYKFTPEELHAALKYCGTSTQPVQWLRENWHKLIQTVQSLATKYGQERVENIIGTISQAEAREALRLHGGNIWQAVSECIGQRQRKFREISSKGNFSREDVVTALTIHQGNADMALLDLGRTQLKPFLMRIRGSPAGVDNESGTSPFAMSNEGTIQAEIHEFLSANALECLQKPNDFGAFMRDHTSLAHEPTNDNRSHTSTDAIYSYSPDHRDATANTFSLDDPTMGNKNMLKDLETLIGNMEQNQAKQNEQVLKSIEAMLGNVLGKKDTDADHDPETMRILMKSPITTAKTKALPVQENNRSQNDVDVKSFVWQHIQEIVPNLVQQVEMELMEQDAIETIELKEPSPIKTDIIEDAHTQPEPPPINAEEFILEEVIGPNIKEASMRELVPPEFIYAAEIANFRMEFDRGLDREHEDEFEMDTLEQAVRLTFKMYQAPEEREVNAEEQPGLSTEQIEQKVDTEIELVTKPEQEQEQIAGERSESTAEELVPTTQQLEVAIDTKIVNNMNEENNRFNGSIPAPESEIIEQKEVVQETLPKKTNKHQKREKRSQLPKNIAARAQKSNQTSSNGGQTASNGVLSNQANQSQDPPTNVYLSQVNSTPTIGNQTMPNQIALEQEPTSQAVLSQAELVSSNAMQEQQEVEDISTQTSYGSTENQSQLISSINTIILGTSSEPSKAPNEASQKDASEGAVSLENVISFAGTGARTKERQVRTSRIPVRRNKRLTGERTPKFSNNASSDSNALTKKLTNNQVGATNSIRDIKDTTSGLVQNINENESTEQLIEGNTTQSDLFADTSLKIDINNLIEENQFASETNTFYTAADTEIQTLTLDNATTANENIENTPVMKSHTTTEEPVNSVKDSMVTNELNTDDNTSVPTIEAITEDVLSQQTEQASNAIENTSTSNKSDEKDEEFQDAEELSEDELDKSEQIITSNTSVTDDDDHHTSDGELYSMDSEDSNREQIQSINSENEVLLVLGSEQSLPIQQSTSNATISSISSQKSLRTRQMPSKEFVPSGDPSKQNLSELVEDTQRLIKQMKDEITIEEFESSEEEYTDEYTDEDDYEEGELEEDWDESLDEDLMENETDYEDESMSEGEIADATFFDEAEEDAINDMLDEENKRPMENVMSEGQTENKEEISTEPQDAERQENNQSDKNKENDIEASSEQQYSDISHVENTSLIEEIMSDEGKEDKEETSTEPKSVRHQESDKSDKEEEIIGNGLSEQQHSQPIITDQQKIVIPTLNNTEFIITIEGPNAASSFTPTEEIPQASITNSTSMNTKPAAINIQESEIATNFEPTALTVTEFESEDKQPELPVEMILLDPDANANAAELGHLVATTNETEAEINEAITNTTQTATSEQTVHDNEPKSHQKEVDVIEAVSEKEEARLEDQDVSSEGNNTNQEALVENNRLLSSQPNNEVIEQNETVSVTERNAKSGSGAISKIPHMIATTPQKQNTPAAAKQQTSLKSKESKIPKQTPTNKMPKRSKSFSGPPGPIGISSVKTIQQEFLNRQKQFSTRYDPPKNPTNLVRKKSITEAITKFTKPTTSSGSSGTAAAAASINGLFRTQPRIPKKKYHETCFSDDDFETNSSEEEPEPNEVRQRKQSVPVFRAYPSVQEPEQVNPETLISKFIEEKLVASIGEAHIAAALVNMKFQQDASLWAARECNDLDQAIALLQQECELCMGTYAMNQIVSMLKCTHKCCKQCAKTYFTVQITDRSINDCNCPFCKIPELHGQNEHEDENLEYFSNLDIFLKNILDAEVHELFQRKLRDRTLLQDPNFKWCVQCSSGFFARPKQKRLICPDCGSVTCSQCRQTWEKQHEGISCDHYMEWKRANDPEVQAQGVQEHLAQNGIDCPKCKFRYSLAKGGCMHFTCTQCKYEFCYGCGKPFMMGAKCSISWYCAKLGLHAHHPRNCLFYLRDKLPLQLQMLLKESNVPFDVEPAADAENQEDQTPDDNGASKLRCPVPLQKETPTGLVDTVCNGEVPDKHAGLCRTHYVEYLTAKVAKARIDPLPIFDLTDCVQELRRRNISLPERGPWDTDEIYKNMCAEVIRKNIPLETT